MAALLGLRHELGWAHREVELEGSTLRDLLRAVRTRDGGDLEQLLCDEKGNLRGCYVVMVNGLRADGADTPLRTGDQVVTTEFFRAVAGG